MYRFKTYFLILIFAILLVCCQWLSAQSLELLKVIDISKEVVKKENWKHLQMFTSDKKRVGNYLVLNMNKLIVSNLDNMKVNDYLNIIIFIETANGNSIVTTLEDYKIINNNIIPYLIIKETNKSPFIPKTLNDTNKEGEVNLTPLENDLFFKTLLYLRIKDKKSNYLKKLIKENTLIFPYDLNSDRWLSGVKYIKILKLKSANKKID